MNLRRSVQFSLSLFLAMSGMDGCKSHVTSATSDLIVQNLTSPAPAGSFSPRLSKLPNGQVLLSWLEPRGEAHGAFRYSIQTDGKWSAPMSIADGLPFSRSASQYPGVVGLPGGGVIAYWNQSPLGAIQGNEEIDVFFSGSADNGVHWTRFSLVNVAGTGQENNYASAAHLDEKRAALIWLDGGEWPKMKRVQREGS